MRVMGRVNQPAVRQEFLSLSTFGGEELLDKEVTRPLIEEYGQLKFNPC